MSYNLSRTLFYEFYKSDPNFIYESVEEYRDYKSDPNFMNKSLEEYRRFKALRAKDIEIANIQSTNEELVSESYENHLEELTTNTCESTEGEINLIKEINTETDNEENSEEDIESEIETEILELEKESMTQQEFERSLEQFWKCDEEKPSIYNSEMDLSIKSNKKKKSKFRIPKSRSTVNLTKVKSRYMDVFKKNK